MIAASASSSAWADETLSAGPSSTDDPASVLPFVSTDAPDATTPVFDQYEAETNTFSGFAPAGSVVAVALSDGALLGEAPVSDAGSFWFTLPDDVSLGDVSVYVEDGQGGAEGGVLTGASMVAALAERTSSSVLSAVGDSTSGLASSFVGSASELASDLGVSGSAAEESLPVVPYALGAASALVAAAAVGGSLLLVRKLGSSDRPFSSGSAQPAEGGHFRAPCDGPAPSGPRHEPDPPCVDARPSRSDDDLESFALSLFGSETPSVTSVSSLPVGRASGCPLVEDGSEDTVSFPVVDLPSDPEDFARVARIIASGSGTVHRVTALKLDADLSGLDKFDDARTPEDPQVANPLVPSDDWRAVAFAELAEERPSSPSPAGRSPRRETKPFAASAAAARNVPSVSEFDEGSAARATAVSNATVRSQGAPVVGPRFMTPDDAAMRRQALDRSDAPEARELRRRDRLFQAQRAGRLSRAKGHRDFEEDGVPVISRGSAFPAAPGPAMRSHYIGDSAREASCSFGVPDPESILPVAATLGCESGVAPSVAVAASAAQIAYAAYAGTGAAASQKAPQIAGGHSSDVPRPRRSSYCSAPVDAQPRSNGLFAASSGVDDHSIAAAYAAAVYAGFDLGTSARAARSDRVLESVPAVRPEGSSGHPLVDDVYATSPLSPAYIDHMVRDEFEHRHDTPAQRNAALGRIRIVNGAACAPVSVREGVAMKRYMA